MGVLGPIVGGLAAGVAGAVVSAALRREPQPGPVVVYPQRQRVRREVKIVHHHHDKEEERECTRAECLSAWVIFLLAMLIIYFMIYVTEQAKKSESVTPVGLSDSDISSIPTTVEKTHSSRVLDSSDAPAPNTKEVTKTKSTWERCINPHTGQPSWRQVKRKVTKHGAEEPLGESTKSDSK